MKQFKFMLTFFAGFIFNFAGFSQTVIDYPDFSTSSDRMIEISAVELSDTATVLYLDAYYTPGGLTQVYVAPRTFLQGNTTEKKYKLINSEGLDKYGVATISPASGIVSYKLYFEPLDEREKSIDYNQYSGQKIYRINGINIDANSRNGKIKTVIKGTVIDRPNSDCIGLFPKYSNLEEPLEKLIPIRDGKFEYTLYSDVEDMYILFFQDEYTSGLTLEPICFFSEGGEIDFILYPAKESVKNNIASSASLNKALQEYEQDLKKRFDFSPFSDVQTKIFTSNHYHSKARNELLEELIGSIRYLDEYRAFIKKSFEFLQTETAYTPEGWKLKQKEIQLTDSVHSWEINYAKNNPSLLGYYRILNLFYMNQETIDDPALTSSCIAVYNETYKEKYPNHPFTEKMKQIIKEETLLK